ncbi:tetratricopeptide repeat protein [Halomonas sp. MCCC 1A17488]|uniref:Tetratricopeptide repeat protein n=1 Tax=Billgrantia sulfidoxydans TaxID=2733484 RepID=A0ABX7W7S9_9GAMM|nr:MULTISPECIES: tetratricopeptide repeat protein [Halomonas]MCE8014571.1 tetratricopeptide repeat protein [Halomonas sp. MCCC 1A17488]MCG3237904.1 tetratricopeptide repeat protein [Halomonas sp. MCCC 1A17488]QPP48308.1 tetratricopeptide repeat protein [Halomonas sp. SS10-MC5]QTP55617.1 tetratricopeptide repeat protein [Halomonas sulfidoxydans]
MPSTLIRSSRHGLAVLGLTVLLGGCQGLASSPLATTLEEDPMASAPPIEHGLDAEGLATLLTAEFAGQRGDYRRATLGYLAMAERYGVAQLAERGTLAARFSNDVLLLEQAVNAWHQLDPLAEAPLRLLAGLALQRGDWDQALERRLALAEQGQHAELTLFAELALEAGADPLPLRERLREYLERTGVDTHPHYHDAVLAMATLEAATGQRQQAERRLSLLERNHSELPALWLTRAQLALEADSPRQAREAARRGLEVSPGDPRFQLLLAQAELMLGNVAAAEQHTSTLMEEHVGNQELHLSLARLYLEGGHLDAARRLLLPLVSSDEPPPAAFYLMGTIAEEEGEIDNALLYYRQVAPGGDFLRARLRAAQMLIADERLLDARAFLRIERLRHESHFSELVALEVELLDEVGRQDDADALLDRELSRTPNDEPLLYLRAMRAWEHGDFEGMERDLGRIIEANPENASALNALGYTLADINDAERLEEARELIERAHALEPGSPAIMDSLGWVHYRLGDPERALAWLERAYASMPDQEIAAHLAEVLWTLDRREEARRVVEQALRQHDEHPLIDALLERVPELAP